MIPYYGDFAEDDTVNIPFNTFDSNDPSESVTVTDLVAADIFVHKDGSATPLTTDGATVAINLNSATGAHMLTIDTSAHADYSVGSEFSVMVLGVTVDAGTLNAWIGSFSIERAGGALALAKLIQAATITNAAGVDIAADIIAVKAETAQIETAVIDNAAGADVAADIIALKTELDLVEAAVITNAAGADVAADIIAVKAETALIKPAVIDNATGADIAADIIAMKAETVLIVADTGPLRTDWVDAGRLDAILDAIKVQTDKLTFTVANKVDSNAKSMNDVTIIGAGTSGDKWRA